MVIADQPVGEPSLDLWLKFRDYIDPAAEEMMLVAAAPAEAIEAFRQYNAVIAGG